MWNPEEHSEDENVQWCGLRAIEWGRWPLFLSQTIGPLLLLRLPISFVIIGFLTLNVLWALVRYRFVSPKFAYIGVLFTFPKILIWIGCAAFFFVHHDTSKALVSLFWLPIISIIGMIPTTQVGILQGRFMETLGLSDVWEQGRAKRRESAVDVAMQMFQQPEDESVWPPPPRRPQ